MRRVPVAGPSITNLEIEYVNDAVKNCWYQNAGKYINKFEDSFAKYCNRRFAISLPSCTSGIHLALMALDLHEGDEVIIPDVTWIASAAPLKYVGATPVFCDIRNDNLTIDHGKLEKLLTKNTKAIIAVNLYGAMPDYNFLQEFCKKHSLYLIEDSAESIGSTFDGKISGSFGDFSVFSFHGSKTLTTGEGGMLLTDNEKLYSRCMMLRDHGRNPGDRFFQNVEIGYKYKMTDLQAALGLAQLERIGELVSGKRFIQNYYQKNISIKGVRVAFEARDVQNSYWMSSIVWDERYSFDKYQLMEKFSEFGIDSRPIFSPLSSLKAYDQEEKYQHTNLISYNYKRNGINLPSALCLKEDDLQYVVETLNKIFTN